MGSLDNWYVNDVRGRGSVVSLSRHFQKYDLSHGARPAGGFLGLTPTDLVEGTPSEGRIFPGILPQ